MANITFSSPSMARDVTIYAVAGDRGTILALAKANKIPYSVRLSGRRMRLVPDRGEAP